MTFMRHNRYIKINKEDATMKLIRAIEKWFHDSETEHRIALIHRYDRILKMKLERGDYSYEAQAGLRRAQS